MPNRVIKHLTVTLSGQSSPETFDIYDDAANALINKMNNVQTKTFASSGWTLNSSTGYYTQSVSITGYNGATVTSSDKPEIFFNTSGVTQANAEDYAEQCGYINNITTGSGVLIAQAYAQPTMNIVVDVKGV